MNQFLSGEPRLHGCCLLRLCFWLFYQSSFRRLENNCFTLGRENHVKDMADYHVTDFYMSPDPPSFMGKHVSKCISVFENICQSFLCYDPLFAGKKLLKRNLISTLEAQLCDAIQIKVQSEKFVQSTTNFLIGNHYKHLWTSQCWTEKETPYSHTGK